MNFVTKPKLWIVIYFFLIMYPTYSEDISQHVSIEKMSIIEAHIEKDLMNWQIPGLSVAIIDNDKIIYRNYGFSDKKMEQMITEHTLFELASNSKAFTAIGLLLLNEEGKISLNDPITKFIPWFKVKYNNENVEINIEDCLYHKSGIPVKTIANISPDIESGAIERVVRNLVGINLDFKPGSNFSYATINYDVLGLVIKAVSGMTYEKYIKEKVLIPLGLNNTYSNYEEAISTGKVSQGYKMNLLKARLYTAPYYRGNVPAGYIFSNSQDSALWLQLQMGIIEAPEPFITIIKKSQKADLSQIDPLHHTSYASGWFYNPDRVELLFNHIGSNPNFSSFFAFNPDKKMGVVVLANINSDITNHIGIGILDILYNSNMLFKSSDKYTMIDKGSFLIILLCIPLILIFLFLFRKLKESIKNKKRIILKKKFHFIKITIVLILLIILGYITYTAPVLFFCGLDWNFINIWASALLFPAIIFLYFSLAIMIGYLTIISSYKVYNNE